LKIENMIKVTKFIKYKTKLFRLTNGFSATKAYMIHYNGQRKQNLRTMKQIKHFTLMKLNWTY